MESSESTLIFSCENAHYSSSIRPGNFIEVISLILHLSYNSTPLDDIC